MKQVPHGHVILIGFFVFYVVPMETPARCRICSSEMEDKIYRVKEMQLGLREEFYYRMCPRCKSLQLQNIPDNPAHYYPRSKYYSFASPLSERVKPDPLRKLRSTYLLYGRNKWLGTLLSLGYKVPDYFDWLRIPAVNFQDKILDVGAGGGSLLSNLHKNGFTNLYGIDPFVEKDIEYPSFRIRKANIFSLTDRYDYIMLHHVFEHMDHPLDVLRQLYQLLKPKRFLLIRTPVMGTSGWRKYGTDWVQLDAPRHIIIHSLESMTLLAEQSGFRLKKIIFDSTAHHIWASEQYKRNIALTDEHSYMVNKQASIFSRKDIKAFNKMAADANAEGQGDQAAFYLFKQ